VRAGEAISHFETIRQRKDGSPISISLTVSPIYDDDGHVIGASKIVRDITERKQAEVSKHLLAEMRERNRLAQELLSRETLDSVQIRRIVAGLPLDEDGPSPRTEPETGKPADKEPVLKPILPPITGSNPATA